MLIRLTEEEIKRCQEFSKKCAENQQEIEFGQNDTAKRSIQEISRDNLIGKLAEVAFAKMLEENFGVKVDLDFEYYPRGVWDSDDVHINGWSIDIKGTRPGSEWMLIEWSKLRFRKKEDKLSHIYVMAVVKWDRKNDVFLGEVDLVGYAMLESLNHGVKGTYILRKDKLLPGKSVKLQADNYGIPIRLLNKDWTSLLEMLTKQKPLDSKNYNIP